MKDVPIVDWCYRGANTLIVLGFAMLCQPFAQTLFEIGFPVLLAGVVLFIVLDHLPTRWSDPHQEP